MKALSPQRSTLRKGGGRERTGSHGVQDDFQGKREKGKGKGWPTEKKTRKKSSPKKHIERGRKQGRKRKQRRAKVLGQEGKRGD